jgi:hypothetical protein
MLDFLHKLCESNNFIVNEFDYSIDIDGLNAKVVIPSHNNSNQEYYLILEYEFVNDCIIDKLVKEYLEKIMDALEALDYTDESFKKNCTLIFCCKIGEVTDQSLLRLEEDPYFFKNNVITYSELELIALQRELNGKYDNYSLNELIVSNSGDFFESFKTLSLEGNHYYPLLIRIITKLPFVHYLPQQNQLDDLDVFIRKYLDSSDLKLLDIVCSSDEVLNQDVIEKIISSADWGTI